MKDLFENEKIRTLGLYQPFASLMLHGKMESRWVKRGNKAPFPLGKYLIYSTQKAYSDSEFLRMSGPEYRDAKRILADEGTTMVRGEALCIGELVEVCPMPKMWLSMAFYWPPVKELEDCDDIAIDGYVLWALWFMEVKRINPFPFKGKQGVGILKASEQAKIRFV